MSIFSHEDANVITLSTGKRVYANNRIVGLVVDGSDKRIYHGYDVCVSSVLDEYYDPEFDDDALTRDECIEVADLMIAAWTAHRAWLAAIPTAAPATP